MSEPHPRRAADSPPAPHDRPLPRGTASRPRNRRQSPPELYQVVIDCRDEAEQRAWYERLRSEGATLRLHVL
jgi:hypothetical protein